jgi:cyanate permease
MEIHDKTESVPRMALRYVGSYLVALTLFTAIGSLVQHFFPTAHRVTRILVITLACLAAVSLLMNFIWEWSAKRKASADALASSNQSLQPTTGRSDV